MRLTSVCVYCGFANNVDPRFKEGARQLGSRLGELGLLLVYGAAGGDGLMGIVAASALQAGGKVCGIIPEHMLNKEAPLENLTELHVIANMHTRKRMMVDRSDAFVILPGGLGTLDETFELLTWKKLELHNKPVIFLNQNGYWDEFLVLIKKMIAEGFCAPEDQDLFQVVTSVEEVLAALNSASPSAESSHTGLM